MPYHKLIVLVSLVIIITSLLVGCQINTPNPNQVGEPSGVNQIATPTRATPTQAATIPALVQHCIPTIDDGLSPSYKSNAPERTKVGSGHVLTGVVRSSADCSPIAGAMIELWPEYAGEGHPDEVRATIYTDSTGAYRFECDPPEHIHMRISASGYKILAQNSYHPDGQAEGTFDIVMVPELP